VLGWYGHKNFGDFLILEGLKKLFDGWRVEAFTSDQNAMVPMIDFDKVNECDLFVLGGGELINTNHLFMPSPSKLFKTSSLGYRIYAKTRFADSWIQRLKIPKAVLGCGVNAERPEQIRPNVIRDLEQFSYIGLRDNASVSMLKSVPRLKSKVHLFHDLAFTLDFASPTKQKKDVAIVIPTDRDTLSDSGVRECGVAGKSWSWLKEKLKPHEKTVFLAFGERDNNDLETCKLLSSCARESEILNANEFSFEQVMRLISESRMVFPYRLHGLVLAFMAGVPYDFWPYHWKLQRVHDTVAGLNIKEIKNMQKEEMKKITDLVNED